MTREEKILEIADILEMETDEFTPDSNLEDLETWDSVAILSFIALMNDKFNKFPNASDINRLKTIEDLLEAMC